MSARDSQRSRWDRRRVGGALIVVGVTVWVVYGAVWMAGGEPEMGRYLPFHLAGVIPGALLNRWPARPDPAEGG